MMSFQGITLIKLVQAPAENKVAIYNIRPLIEQLAYSNELYNINIVGSGIQTLPCQLYTYTAVHTQSSHKTSIIVYSYHQLVHIIHK